MRAAHGPDDQIRSHWYGVNKQHFASGIKTDGLLLLGGKNAPIQDGDPVRLILWNIPLHRIMGRKAIGNKLIWW